VKDRSNIMASKKMNIEKHTSRNPLLRKTMEKFNTAVAFMAAEAGPKTVLDIGCGEGFTTMAIADRLPGAKVTALDVDRTAIAYAKKHSQRRNITYGHGDIFSIKGRYDLVVCNEVLEHLDAYEKALDSVFSASRRHVLVSVPNEPLFRLANMARLRHASRLGNPRGHVNHWTRKQLSRILSRHGRIVEVRTSGFWNIALVEVGSG